MSKQLYFPDTAILITRFMTPDGVGEVHDFMPVITGAATDRHRLVRQLRVVRGTMRFVMDIQPAFDYARQPHKVEMTENGAVFEAEGMELTLHWARPADDSPRDADDMIEQHGDGVRATRTLRAGESAGMVLESMGGRPRLMARRGDPAAAARHGGVLARLGAQVDLHRPLARDGFAVGDNPQDDDLPANRRTGRRADHRTA